MRTIIIYFSQTGNTGKIARAVLEGLKPAMEVCDIVKLKEASTRDLRRYDLIGLGSPIWRLGAPNNVVAFLNELPRLGGKLSFVFCTHGAYPIGFMKRVVPVLQRKGLTIVGFNDWYGGVYLPYVPAPYLTDGHPDAIDVEEARAWGEETAQRALKIGAGDVSQIPRLPGEEENSLFRYAPEKESAVADLRRKIQRNMRINMQRCKYPECTICVDNCPMDAIDFSVSPPVFKRFCHADFFCEAVCPVGAIEADFATLSAEHDKIVQGEYSRFVSEAEAKGRFRRLVPPEKLNLGRHKYETTRRPRLKPS